MAQILANALSRLASASKQPARSRSQPIDQAVQTICDSAYRHGLSEESLDAVVQVVRKPTYLDQSTVTTLIKNLYPATKIGANIVYDIVASIGPGSDRPSIATQSLLLQWMLLVKDFLVDDSALANCYSALFNQLHALGTRPTLCHLLAVLTRRRHVKPWRIRGLLDLARNATNDTGLLSLLRIYKDFYPTIVLDQPIGRVRAAGFKVPDPEWRHHLLTLQKRNAETEAPNGTSSFRVLRRGAKRSRVEVVPEVYTANAVENTTSLEEIDGVVDFAERLDKIEPPSQMVSALDDPLLQKYFYLVDSDYLRTRLDTWLSFYLESQLQPMADGEKDPSLEDVLQKMLHYARATKSLPVSALSFLNHVVDDWAGEVWQDQILELFTFLPLQPFNDLHTSLLSRLENCILSNTTPRRLLVLLKCYTGLLRNWSLQLLHDPSTKSKENLDVLSGHSTLLAMQIVAIEPQLPDSFVVLHNFAALAHISQLASTHTNLRILTPDSHILYLLAFQHPTLAILSPLCGILATYKLAFEVSMAAISSQASQPTPPSTHESGVRRAPYPPAYVNEFNGFLMDVCNLLWRSRAFNRHDTNAHGCLVAPVVLAPLQRHLEARAPPQSLAAIFALSHHPALAAAAIAAMRTLEDAAGKPADAAADAMPLDPDPDGAIAVRHAGPVTQKSLALLASQGGLTISWAAYRLEVLRWLTAHGVPGVTALMFCTMKLLIGEKRASGSNVGVRA